MESHRYSCPGCGSTIMAENIDFKTRQATCEFCGLHFVLAKRHSSASPNALIALGEAMRSFELGNINNAKTYAEDVLSMVTSNIVASFIIAYHQAFISEQKSLTQLDNLFKKTLPTYEFDFEEEDDFKKLLLKTIQNTSEYQKEILHRFLEYDDPLELKEFVEEYAPFVILKARDFDWFDKEMADIYLGIAKKCSIPKTTYALISLLIKCPNSPLVANNFFLVTRSERIYNNYVLPVGEIVNCNKDGGTMEKFKTAYKKIETTYLNKLNQAKED